MGEKRVKKVLISHVLWLCVFSVVCYSIVLVCTSAIQNFLFFGGGGGGGGAISEFGEKGKY